MNWKNILAHEYCIQFSFTFRQCCKKARHRKSYPIQRQLNLLLLKMMSLTSFLKTARGEKMRVRIGNWERTRRIKESSPPASRYLTEMGVGRCPPRGIRGHPYRACSPPPQSKWVLQHFLVIRILYIFKNSLYECFNPLFENFNMYFGIFFLWLMIFEHFKYFVENLRVFQTCLLSYKTNML